MSLLEQENDYDPISSRVQVKLTLLGIRPMPRYTGLKSRARYFTRLTKLDLE